MLPRSNQSVGSPAHHVPPNPCLSTLTPRVCSPHVTVKSRHSGIRLPGSEAWSGCLLSVTLGKLLPCEPQALHPALVAAGTVTEGSTAQAPRSALEVCVIIPILRMRKHSRRGAWLCPRQLLGNGAGT